jgi:hypothetical protein
MQNLPNTIEEAMQKSAINPMFYCGPMKIQLPKSIMSHLTEITESELSSINRYNLKKEIVARAFNGIGSFAIYHRINDEFKNFLKECAVKYAELLNIKGQLFGSGDGAIQDKNDIIIRGCWGISNKEDDYNPLHFHFGKLSGVIYIKVPEQIADGTREKEHGVPENHGLCDGRLEIIYGSNYPFNFGTIGHRKITPVEGDMYVFPAWTPHTVYPFKGEGERRIVSFNLDWKT